MRKIYATLTVNVILSADSDLNLDEYMDNVRLDMNCLDKKLKDKADIQDLTIETVEVTDSK